MKLASPPSPAMKLLSDSDFKRLFASAEIGMLSLDAAGTIVDINAYLASLLHYSAEDLKGRLLWHIGGSLASGADFEAVQRLRQLGHLRHSDLPLKCQDGMRIDFEFRCRGRLADNTQLIECRFHELEVEPPDSQQTADAATPQRRRILHLSRLEACIHHQIEATRNGGPPFSMLSIGVDRIDSTLADNTSSAPMVLRGLATVCARLLRAGDIVGRIDESTFIALLPGVVTKGALCAAERLRTAIASMETPGLRGRFRGITVSIGVVSTRNGRTSYKALRSRAEAKRDDARSSGGNRVSA